MLFDFIRFAFLIVDGVIYTVIALLYKLFFDITNVLLFTSDDVKQILARIYVLLGVFMLFKITIELLNMFMNPDTFTDKSKGGANLVKNIMITLVILGITPWAFQQAYKIQHIVIEKNIINVIILGNGAETTQESDKELIGKNMAGNIFVGFFNDPANPEIAKMVMNGNFFLLQGYVNDKTGGEYNIDYRLLISTIAGLFAGWIILNFVFDIAVRTVKLSFLQVTAPIPIIMRLGGSKGEQRFQKWLIVTISTYLDVFMRIAIINLGTYVIYNLSQLKYGQIDAEGNINTATFTDGGNLFMYSMLILGVLMFIKQTPQLIEDIFGIKLNTSLKLNPFDRLADVPVAGAGYAMAKGGIDAIRYGGKFWQGAIAAKDDFAKNKNFSGSAPNKNAARQARRAQQAALNQALAQQQLLQKNMQKYGGTPTKGSVKDLYSPPYYEQLVKFEDAEDDKKAAEAAVKNQSAVSLAARQAAEIAQVDMDNADRAASNALRQYEEAVQQAKTARGAEEQQAAMQNLLAAKGTLDAATRSQTATSQTLASALQAKHTEESKLATLQQDLAAKEKTFTKEKGKMDKMDETYKQDAEIKKARIKNGDKASGR